MTKAVENDHALDVILALYVELAGSGVRIKVDHGVFYSVDAHEGDDGNPTGVGALQVIAIVDGGLEGYIDVALYIGDTEGVACGGLTVAISPFVRSTAGAGGIEDCCIAGIEMPFAIDGTNDRSLVDSE